MLCRRPGCAQGGLYMDYLWKPCAQWQPLFQPAVGCLVMAGLRECVTGHFMHSVDAKLCFPGLQLV